MNKKKLNKTLKQAIKNGGLTLNQKGIPMNFKKGYQVSIQDCYILDLNNTNMILSCINNLSHSINKNKYLGLWIEDSKIYIDISIKILNKKQAIESAKNLNQISIFNWHNQKTIYINK